MEENTLIKRFPLVTVLITVINVAAFFITEWKGSTLDPDFMIEAGGMYAPAFFGEHEYYRLITHFFLHFGIEHLFFNMVSLVMFGHVIENIVGRLWFAGIYLISGIAAGLVSVTAHFNQDAQIVSCGASGAVYGVMGAFIVMLIVNQRNNLRREILRFAAYVALNLYYGRVYPEVDQYAHVGGFAAGVVLCIGMYLIKRIVSIRKERVM